MDKREKAIRDMQEMIRRKRAEIDPAVLEKAQHAAMEKLKGRKEKPPSGTVPYDKEAARRAVEMFIARHPEQKKFRSRLLDFLQKNSH